MIVRVPAAAQQRIVILGGGFGGVMPLFILKKNGAVATGA